MPTVRSLVTVLLGSLGLIVSPRAAADLAVEVKIGTLGVGVEGFTPLSREVNLRAVISGYRVSGEHEAAGLSYAADLRLATGGSVLDWHPYGGRFRVSAGLLANANRAVLAAGCGGSCVVNGRAIRSSSTDPGTIVGDLDFGRGASYLGIGWVFAPRLSPWFWSADAGALFQNKPKANLSSRGSFVDATTGEPIPDATLEADLDAEQLELEQALESLDIYPALSLGFGYRF